MPSPRARILAVAAVGGVIAAACSASAGPVAAPSAAVRAAPPTPAPSVAAAAPATPGPTRLDTAVDAPAFGIALTLDLPHPWMALYGVGGPDGAIDLVHRGDPPGDESQWWGPWIA